MDVDGKGSSWRHRRKGAEPRHVTHVALFTFSTAMLLALFSLFTSKFKWIKFKLKHQRTCRFEISDTLEWLPR